MTGSILRGIGSFYTVLCDEDGFEYTLRAQKKLRHQKMTPMVGDRVRFTPGDGEDNGWLEEILPQLPPLQIGKHGQLMEWSEDFEEWEHGHRHISHLYGLHPASEITQSTPEYFAAARKTIERRLANGGGHTGWSRVWIINFFARLLDGNTAYKNIVALFKNSTLPNMFDNHPPFQIDGNFGGTAGITEMLLQSHDGFIDILPALPDAWAAGEFNGLMARGGYKVSVRWEEGKATFCVITGKDDKPFRVKINGQMHDAVGSFIYTL